MSEAKPFSISKDLVARAWQLVKAKRGAAGVDGRSVWAFEEELGNNLYKVWNRMSSGSYFPPPVRRVEIPKGDGRWRTLGIPTVADRVAQMVAKMTLEPRVEPVFHPDSYGYRPGKSALEAVGVARERCLSMDWVIDLDIRDFFDTVRHHIVLEKVARRVRDDEVLRLLKMIMKASGKRGVPQGGVISPLLSNIYLDDVDRMLERAKQVTRYGRWTAIEYARFADDLVVLVDAHPRHRWLRRAVEKRLREELAKLQLEVNEDKTREVDLARGESFGFLGFDFRRVRSRAGRWMPLYMPQRGKRTALLRKLKECFRRSRSHPIRGVIEVINPILRGWVGYFAIGHSSRCFSFIRNWVEQKIRCHLSRARQRRGFGWKRWSRPWLYEALGLFNNYRVRRPWTTPKAAPA